MGARKNWSQEQIIGILKQVEAGRSVAEVCRENSVGESTFYKWKSKYGGLEVNEARRLKTLEEENARRQATSCQSLQGLFRFVTAAGLPAGWVTALHLSLSKSAQ